MFPITVMGKLADAGDIGLIATFVAGTGFALGRLIVDDNMALTLERYILMLVLVPISVALIFWMIGFTGDEGYKGVLICVLGFAAVAGLGFLIHGVFKKSAGSINRFIQQITMNRALRYLIYFFWAVTAFAVCTWQEIMTGLPENSGFYRLFILTLSGILPYRILWAFVPPRNKTTSIVAAIVVAITLVVVYLG